MLSAPGMYAPPIDDTFVFDLKNGLRVWLSEMVSRREIVAHEAEAAIKRIDVSKVVEVTEDQVKLWLGPLKDSVGTVGLAKKLVKDFGKWWNVRVYFKAGAKGDLVIIRGWPSGRQLLKGTRYKVDNVKIMEMQIGKPGILAAAKESARFGVILVVAVDLIEFTRDHNFAHLLGSLTVDIPSVLIASAIGAAAGSAATTLMAGGLAIGTFALGPALVAFGVGILVGYALYKLDKHFHITDKVTAAYEVALVKLERWWHNVGVEARKKWTEFVQSQTIKDMQREWSSFERRLQGDGPLLMSYSLF